MVCGKSNLNPSGRVTVARLTSSEGGVEALGFSRLHYLLGRPSRDCLGLFPPAEVLLSGAGRPRPGRVSGLGFWGAGARSGVFPLEAGTFDLWRRGAHL